MTSMPVPWRIEGKATPFSAWQVIEPAWRIEEAAKRATEIKRAGIWYATRVRPA